MYYDDLAALGKEMSSLCTLADAAIMFSENEDYCLRLLAKKANSKRQEEEEEEEEEETEYSFLHTFPRKSRSPLLKKSRYSKQNLNGGASTSSSLPLFDLNKIPTDSNTQEEDSRINLQWPNVSSFLRDQKIKPESQTLSSSLPFNLNKIPTDSNIQEDSRINLQWPNVSSKTNRKRRRVVQDKRSNGESKKVKVMMKRETPEWLVKMMKDMKGREQEEAEEEDARLIFQESLSASDVNPKESRLLIPFEQLTRNDFLTQVESSYISQDKDFNNDVNTKPGLGVILVNKCSEKWGLIFKRWDMKKKVAGKTLNYALNCGWNDVVSANGLKEGDNISLWSFRWKGVLCFALETE